MKITLHYEFKNKKLKLDSKQSSYKKEYYVMRKIKLIKWSVYFLAHPSFR